MSSSEKPETHTIRPSQKAVKDYYAALATYAKQHVEHESAVRSAFQNLLDETGRRFGWTLVPELSDTAAGHGIRPDGTFRDDFHIRRGHWEAKDTHDKLEDEIQKKIDRGYPLLNTIFEDTRTACLFQNGRQAMRVDITQPQQLCDLLTAFFTHVEPAHQDFGKAIGEFKERVPELARGLVQKIEEAHRENVEFQAAFQGFYDLCKASLNPNLSRAAVDEMLVQHLLTERLIRRIFDQDDFVQRNVIAAEIEKVIGALTKTAFSRHAFLKSLDRFYVAIERAAATIEGFTGKQHFLNVIYERFFQGYSVRVADTHGIVYTPQEIVDFMCASVAEVLESEFGKKLGDAGVHILDPCTGTGNFIVNLIRRIPKCDLPRMYGVRREREESLSGGQLFANEVMLMPYYIAALNIEHAYYEQTGEYQPFEGLCFVDTLDLAEDRDAAGMTQRVMGFKVEANTKRVQKQRETPITVILGNPPYNAWQLNENDNNKNRKYEVVDRRVSQTYAKDSRASNKNALSDMYVKFFRWATDRLNGRDGIVAFVTNNSFVDQIAFDGMRKHLLEDFTRVYHLHLEGNVRQNPKLSGTAYNVFGIQVGVGITVAVRSHRHRGHRLFFHRVDKGLRRRKKLDWLAQHGSVQSVKWQTLKPDGRFRWLGTDTREGFQFLPPIATESAKRSQALDEPALFKVYSNGVQTNRDDWVYDFKRERLAEKVSRLIDMYNSEVDRWKRARAPKDIDAFVLTDDEKIKWCSRLKETLARGLYASYRAESIRLALYRPFTRRLLFFDPLLNHRQARFREILPNAATEDENRLIWLKVGSEWPMFALAAHLIVDQLPQGGTQCFPFYTYKEDGTERRENITDWALKHFRAHYRNRRITKWDIFHYVYGLLHHPGYRQRYAENLKRELPRIPLAPDFKAFREAGRRLAHLHLDYEKLEPWPLDWIETPDVPLSYRVEKMRLSKDVTSLKVNGSLALGAIPPEVFDYRLGNRSALEWVIDQYQVTTDKRSGITSDPNRPEDPEYIVRLVGQVVRVSVETVRIVNALPADFGGAA